MKTAYVYDINNESEVVAIINGADERAIEKAFERKFNTDTHGLTYRNPEPQGVKLGDGWKAPAVINA